MANALQHGQENFGVSEFVRRSPDELADLYPGQPWGLLAPPAASDLVIVVDLVLGRFR